MPMPMSSSRVLSRNGRFGPGVELRCGGGAAGGCGAGTSRSVSAMSSAAWACRSREAPGLLLGGEQVLELGHELADVAEVAIHGGEAHVCDLVEPLELLHHKGAHFLGAH